MEITVIKTPIKKKNKCRIYGHSYSGFNNEQRLSVHVSKIDNDDGGIKLEFTPEEAKNIIETWQQFMTDHKL